MKFLNLLKNNILIKKIIKEKEIYITGIYSFTGLSALSSFHYNFPELSDYTFLLGSFGATSVLVYGFPNAPFSQPKNVIWGNLISSTIGISTLKLTEIGMIDTYMAIPLSVSLSTMFMLKTDTVHPPAGGTAMIAAMGTGCISNMGYSFIIPTFFGSMFLYSSSFLFNKIKNSI